MLPSLLYFSGIRSLWFGRGDRLRAGSRSTSKSNSEAELVSSVIITGLGLERDVLDLLRDLVARSTDKFEDR